MSDIWENIKSQVVEEINACERMEDEQLMELIDQKLFEQSEKNYIPLKEKIRLKKSLFDMFRRLGPLQELVDDPSVTEIMVNGSKEIFIEKDGRTQKWQKKFEDEDQLEDLIQKIVGRVNRIVNRATPICDAMLEDGSRVNIVLPPIALNGPVLTIRKFPEVFSMRRLVENGTISKEAVEFLSVLVRCGYNIFVSGGTGSGKTTFLNALSEYIPKDSRVITMEDAAELQIQHVDNLVRLETRNENIEGEGEISMGELIRAALRMNPDRIIVGEVRGKEALDMLSAMNTGHDGSLSTGHANSPADMLRRLESMVLMGADLPLIAIQRQIASAIDILIHIGRLRDKSRKILAITEVGECENGEISLYPIFEFQETEGDGQTQHNHETKKNEQEKVEGMLVQVGKLHNCRKIWSAGYSV